MSKQGTLISVAENQEGASPEIVTEDRPFPVSVLEVADRPDTQDVLDKSLVNLIGELIIEQRLTNLYLSKLVDEDLRDDNELELRI